MTLFSEDVFSNFVDAKLKVDETFITDNGIARKRKSLMLKLLGMIAPQLVLILLIYQRFTVNY